MYSETVPKWNINSKEDFKGSYAVFRTSPKTREEIESKAKDKETWDNSMYKCLRPLFLVGSCLGFFPIDGLFQKNSQLLSFRRKSIKGCMVILIILSLLLNSMMGLICLLRMESKNLPEIVWAANPIIFYFVGLFGYTYMFLYMDQLLEIIKNWQSIKLSFECEDKKLLRDTNIIFVLVFSSAVLENLLQQSIQLSLFDFTRKSEKDLILNATELDWTPLEQYYKRTKQPQWEMLVPYNPTLAVLMFIWNKLALYSWNLLDIFIILISRVINFQFKAIARHAQKTVTSITNDGLNIICSPMETKLASEVRIQWEEMSTDFEVLYAVLENIKTFLSPIVFISYMVNLFFIIVHLHMGLTPVENKGAAAEVYRTWSFVHITGRVYLITLFAARINEFAEEFVDIIRKCPNHSYTKKIERIERFIKTTKPGIGGLNCFVVTKPFMLSLVSVVVTFEIVLLQTSGFSYF